MRHGLASFFVGYVPGGVGFDPRAVTGASLHSIHCFCGNKNDWEDKNVKIAKKLASLMALALVVTSISVNAGNAEAKKRAPVLSKKKASIEVGKSITLKVKNNKKKVKWTSSKKKVAIVTKKGKVTAKKAGKTKITAKFGKKKLVCKVTVVKPKKNNKIVRQTEAPAVPAVPAATITSIASVEILDSDTIEVVLNQPQALTKDAFTVESKRYAIGPYNNMIKVDNVYTDDNKIYYVELDQDEYISKGTYVRVTVAGILGKAVDEQLYTGAISNKDNDRNVYVISKGEKISRNIYCDSGYGYSKVTSVDLPSGLTYKIKSDEGKKVVSIEGSFAVAGKYEGSVVSKDEFGNVNTEKFIWLVQDSGTIVADIPDLYCLYYSSKDSGFASYSSLMTIAGGSGKYKYQIINQSAELSGSYSQEDTVNAENGYAKKYISTGIEAPVDRVLDIRITDVDNPAIQTVVKWPVHVKQGRRVSGTVKDGSGTDLENYSISIKNRDVDSKFPDYSGMKTIFDTASNICSYELYVADGVYDISVSSGNANKTYYKTAINSDITKDLMIPGAYMVELIDDSEYSAQSWYDADENYVGYGNKLCLKNGTYNLTSSGDSGFNSYNKTVSVVVNNAKTTAVVKTDVSDMRVGEITVDNDISISFAPNDSVYRYYKFVPTVSGTYQFYSKSSSDTYGKLCDATGVSYCTDDDSGDGNNFKIEYECQAGVEYNIGVYLYSSYADSRQINLCVSRVMDNIE